ncbi:MFS transporter [Streptomyces sp. NPDC001450]
MSRARGSGRRGGVDHGPVAAAGLLVLSLAPASAPTRLVVLLMIPVGAGGSLAVLAVTALLLDRVPTDRAGTASGVLNASRQVGGALAC